MIKLLSAIGSPERVEAYIEGMISRKEKVPGFGHRVYKTEDPRATHLRKFSKELGRRSGEPKWYEISRGIEEVMVAKGMVDRGICANVDFYSASVYYYIGIPTDLFTPVFALSRIVDGRATSWSSTRITTDSSPGEYTGPHSVPYIPIDQRG